MNPVFIALIVAVILNVVVVVVAWIWPRRARYFALAELLVLAYVIYSIVRSLAAA